MQCWYAQAVATKGDLDGLKLLEPRNAQHCDHAEHHPLPVPKPYSKLKRPTKPQILSFPQVVGVVVATKFAMKAQHVGVKCILFGKVRGGDTAL